MAEYNFLAENPSLATILKQVKLRHLNLLHNGRIEAYFTDTVGLTINCDVFQHPVVLIVVNDPSPDPITVQLPHARLMEATVPQSAYFGLICIIYTGVPDRLVHFTPNLNYSLNLQIPGAPVTKTLQGTLTAPSLDHLLHLYAVMGSSAHGSNETVLYQIHTHGEAPIRTTYGQLAYYYGNTIGPDAPESPANALDNPVPGLGVGNTWLLQESPQNDFTQSAPGILRYTPTDTITEAVYGRLCYDASVWITNPDSNYQLSIRHNGITLDLSRRIEGTGTVAPPGIGDVARTFNGHIDLALQPNDTLQMYFQSLSGDFECQFFSASLSFNGTKQPIPIIT